MVVFSQRRMQNSYTGIYFSKKLVKINVNSTQYDKRKAKMILKFSIGVSGHLHFKYG